MDSLRDRAKLTDDERGLISRPVGYGSVGKQRITIADAATKKAIRVALAEVEPLRDFAAIVADMKAYLMLGKVHADWLQKELLEKYEATDFQHMAFIAYEKADQALVAFDAMKAEVEAP